MDRTNSLVSIIVITYNSAEYVLETLESVKEQDYEEIELIVSDDCSSDNTFDICKNWIANNKNRFVNTEVITVEQNKGIASNCNRGITLSKGEWIKVIAGDDMLLSNCISDYIIYIQKHNENPLFVHSNFFYFYNDKGKEELFKVEKSTDYFNLPGITSSKQLKLIYRDNHYIGAPSVFFKRLLWEQLGGYNENLPYEDWPFYIKTLKAGNKIHFAQFFSVLYRMHDKSVFNNKKKGRIFNSFYRRNRLVYHECLKENLTYLERINENIYYYFLVFFDALNLNRQFNLNLKLYTIITNIYQFNKRAFRYLIKNNLALL